MGGGKNQKGGKHGFIGRTLAHDILAKQALRGEEARRSITSSRNEQSVFERNSLVEYTLAASQGLEDYIKQHAPTREIVASDFHSQVSRMVNYNEHKDVKVYPTVPIPRRCIFFAEEDRIQIERNARQKSKDMHDMYKKIYKRKNKKMVDMYMKGSHPKPLHGIYDDLHKRFNVGKVRFNHRDGGIEGSEVDDDDEEDILDDEGNSGDEWALNSEKQFKSFKSGTKNVSHKAASDETRERDEYATDNLPKPTSDTTQKPPGEEDEIDDDDNESQWESEEESSDGVCVDDARVAVKESQDTLTDGNNRYLVQYREALDKELQGVVTSHLNSEELDHIETRCFYAWRHVLSKIEELENIVVTPYEKNIEFWRQLWRVIERSHLVLTIVDARDPLFYRVKDLETYIKEVNPNKRFLLVLNKADYVSLDIRKQWADFFKSEGVDFVYFSVYWSMEKHDDLEYLEKSEECDDTCRIYNVEEFIKKLEAYKRILSPVFPELQSDSDNGHPIFTVGCVGYPNVGKSSLINCLLEATKTTISSQPGKTKHLQTLPLKSANLTLCDCPGLIFPSIVSTKHHLLVNSIVSTSHFRGSLIFAVQLICNRIPHQLCKRYDVDMSECLVYNKHNLPVLFSQKLLEEICKRRKYFAGGKGGQLDLGRAAKLVLADYTSGSLLYCTLPPNATLEDSFETLKISDAHVSAPMNGPTSACCDAKSAQQLNKEEGKLQEWMVSSLLQPQQPERRVTKRKMRFLLKAQRKGAERVQV